MVEMLRGLKIVVIIDIIVAFIYGFLYLLIPEYYAELSDSPTFDIHMWRIVGGTIIVLGIGAIIGLKRSEWESFKPVL